MTNGRKALPASTPDEEINIMKWDFKTDPPTAWKVEDGDWVPISPERIKRCSVCGKWYEINYFAGDRGVCSPGCAMRANEIKAKDDRKK